MTTSIGRGFLAVNKTEKIMVEPSSAAGFPGLFRLINGNQAYLEQIKCNTKQISNSAHIVWGTGGSMVPEIEMEKYINTGNSLLHKCSREINLNL